MVVKLEEASFHDDFNNARSFISHSFPLSSSQFLKRSFLEPKSIIKVVVHPHLVPFRGLSMVL